MDTGFTLQIQSFIHRIRLFKFQIKLFTNEILPLQFFYDLSWKIYKKPLGIYNIHGTYFMINLLKKVINYICKNHL